MNFDGNASDRGLSIVVKIFSVEVCLQKPRRGRSCQSAACHCTASRCEQPRYQYHSLLTAAVLPVSVNCRGKFTTTILCELPRYYQSM